MNWKLLARHGVTLVAPLSAAALLLTGCGGDGPDASAATKRATPPSHARTTASNSPSPSPSPSLSATSSARAKAADGANLDACNDGACEVEIKTGDVIRFGSQVKTKPRVDSLTVVGVTRNGPTLLLSSGVTTTAYGGIEINGGISLGTVYAEGNRAVVRISRIS
ncbi:hypothetical protein QF035_010242 [Streptomyces umbrinus]|uniref:Lipoprotein n=1 Tax=Streptomyces umbrinus TaxID=67370 RepID=A0ABU0TA20_9ACTN|nr:hypothetical protein [Streptomyces umbrinus]MDQ1032660.1 hypothetical protein [Streptomyces umbrinus]